MDDNLPELFAKVLSTEPLMKTVDRVLKKEPNTLNLVTSDWKDVLENNLHYQDLKDKKCSFTRESLKPTYKIQFASKHMHVIVMGIFSVTEKNVTCVSCPALFEIAKAHFTSHQDFKAVENSTLYVNECNPYDCKKCRKTYADHKYTGTAIEWCVDRTYSFNGETVDRVYRQFILNHYRGSNPAILRIKIDCRIFFQDKETKEKFGKIGGKISDIIMFKEKHFENKQEETVEEISVLPPPAPFSEMSKPQDDQMIVTKRTSLNFEDDPYGDDICTIISSKTLQGEFSTPENNLECEENVADDDDTIIFSTNLEGDVSPSIINPNNIEDLRKNEIMLTEKEEKIDCIPNNIKRPSEMPERHYDVEVKRMKMSELSELNM